MRTTPGPDHIVTNRITWGGLIPGGIWLVGGSGFEVRNYEKGS